MFNPSQRRRARELAQLLVLILLCNLPAKPIVGTTKSESETASQQPAQRMETGQSYTFELNTEQKQEFRLLVNEGEYLHIVAEQKGIDFYLRISGPTKAQVIAIESPTGLQGPEVLSFIAKESGDYLLEVVPNEKGAPTRSYTIRAERKTTPTKGDHDRAEATMAVATAQALSQGPEASKRLALEKFNQARQLWRSLSEPEQEARAFMGAGRVNRLLRNREAAVEAYENALAIWRAEHNSYAEAQTLNDIGRTLFALDRRRQCFPLHDQALLIFRRLNELSAQSSTLNVIGITHNSLTNPDAAIPNFTAALQLAEQANDRYRQNAALLGLGGAYDLAGEFYASLSHYQRALTLVRELSLHARIASTHINIGVVSDNLGEWNDALTSYEEAMALRQSLPKNDQITLLANLGMLHTLQGDTAGALKYYDEGLLLQGETKSTSHLAVLLNGIGLVWAKEGDFDKARGFYERAIPLHEEAQELRGKAYTLTNLGIVLSHSGDLPEALKRYEEAKAIWNLLDVKEPQGQAYTLDKMGEAYLRSGNSDKASDTYRQALAIWEKIKDPRGRASSLLGLARTDEKSHRLKEALTLSDIALNIVESQRTKGAGQWLRISYLASKQELFEFAISIRMRLHEENPNEGYDEQALLINERFRARSLIDTLTKTGIQIRQGINPSLREEQISLEMQLTDKEGRLRRLARRGEKAEDAERESAKLSAMMGNLQGRIRSDSPHYANLTQPLPINLSQIQQQVLDDDNTLLLEYMLGEERSYLWAVSRTGKIKSHVLPPRREIEGKAREVKCLLTKGGTQGYGGKVTGCLDSDQTQYWTKAWELSHLILGPVADIIGNKRLLIVADGELQYLPFGALPPPMPSIAAGHHVDNQGSKSAKSPSPLFLQNEIVYEPSASTVAILRRETAGRAQATKTIAILADPVFEQKDSRFLKKGFTAPTQLKSGHGKGVEPPGTNSIVAARTDSVDSNAGPVLARLLSSGEEARTITALVPPAKRLVATGFAANRTTATSAKLTQYRNVHFATHAVIDDQKPELSGIALSRFDEDGRPQPNNFLRLQDIYDLKLPSDLVVLSACNTALGKRVKGEGLMSLTRGFMYAGAKRIVSSLWQVDDESTAELMGHFYRHMLKERMTPAAALRAAQIDLWKEAPDRSPYYWGAFIIQGEWR